MRSVHVLVPSGGSLAVEVDEAITAQELIENVLPVPLPCYLTLGTQLCSGDDFIRAGDCVRLHVRCVGGKGGYGATLRAMGRKGGITENSGDCRDLQGRRLRDVEAAKRQGEVVQRKRAREAEEHEAKVARKAAQLASKKDEEQEIKDAIAASRCSGFEDTATASVAGGLAKATAAASCKDELPKPKPKNLKAFDAFGDTDSSSSDDEDSSAQEKR